MEMSLVYSRCLSRQERRRRAKWSRKQKEKEGEDRQTNEGKQRWPCFFMLNSVASTSTTPFVRERERRGQLRRVGRDLARQPLYSRSPEGSEQRRGEREKYRRDDQFAAHKDPIRENAERCRCRGHHSRSLLRTYISSPLLKACGPRKLRIKLVKLSGGGCEGGCNAMIRVFYSGKTQGRETTDCRGRGGHACGSAIAELLVNSCFFPPSLVKVCSSRATYATRRRRRRRNAAASAAAAASSTSRRTIDAKNLRAKAVGGRDIRSLEI
jgi:hypothetical protein